MFRCIYALLFLISSYSVASVSLIPTAGFNLDTPKLQGSSGVIASNGTVMLAGGIGINIGLYKALEFEFGGYYSPRKYSYTTSLGAETDELTSVVVPVLLRLRLSRFLSIGAGAFSGIGVGKVKASTSTTSVEYTYNEAQVHDLNYGVAGSFAIELPISKTLAFTIDGRYLYGLQDLLRATTQKLETRELQVLWGFRIIL